MYLDAIVNKSRYTDKHTADGHSTWPFLSTPPISGSQGQQVKTGPTWMGHFWFKGEASPSLSFLLCSLSFLYSHALHLCDSEWDQVSMCQIISAGQMGLSRGDPPDVTIRQPEICSLLEQRSNGRNVQVHTYNALDLRMDNRRLPTFKERTISRPFAPSRCL